MKLQGLKRYEVGDIIIFSREEHDNAALIFINDLANRGEMHVNYYWGRLAPNGVIDSLDRYVQKHRSEVFTNEGEYTNWGKEVHKLYQVECVFTKESLERFKVDVAGL